MVSGRLGAHLQGIGTRARGLKLVDAPSRATSTRPAERLLGLVARPALAELVGDVGDDEPAGAGGAAVLAGLARRQVPADAGALGPRERPLDQQQVGVAGEVDEIVASASSRRRR